MNRFYISNYMLRDLFDAREVEVLYQYKFFDQSRIKFIRDFYDFLADKRWQSKARRTQAMLHALVKRRVSSEFVVLMTNEMLNHLAASDLKKLKSHDIKLALILIDCLTTNSREAEIAKQYLREVEFDFIGTFDPKDAAEYGFEYCNSLYSKVLDLPKVAPSYDICYIGNIKDRLPRILEFREFAQKNGTHSLMKLAQCNEKQRRLLPPEAVLEREMSYPRSLMLTNQANCIFDMTPEGQTGVTLRYYEAIVYNKKLLTNNRAIENMPFFDERYIKFYDDAQDVDWNWVKAVEDVDYGYDGTFSPVKLLATMEKQLFPPVRSGAGNNGKDWAPTR